MAASVDASAILALVQRLRGGRRTEQLRAAQELCPVATLCAVGDPSRGLRQAAVDAGAVPMPAQPMSGSSSSSSSSSSAVRRSACGTVSHGITSGGHGAFVAAGGLAVLQNCLFRCSDEAAQNDAAALACNLLLDSSPRCAECRDALADSLPAIARLLGSRPPLSAAAAALLRNIMASGQRLSLSVAQQLQQAAVAAGAVPALARLLADGNAEEQHDALGALSNLASGGMQCKAAMAAGSVLSVVVLLLSSDSRAAQHRAALVVANLSTERGPHIEALVQAGTVPRLTALLTSKYANVQQMAVLALDNLCTFGGPESCREVAAAGAVAALHSAQQSGSQCVQQAASRLLQALQAAADAAVPTATSQVTPNASQTNAPASTKKRPPAPRICAAPGCSATSGLRRCGGCGTVRYCSAACSHAHWREHRAKCWRLQAEQAAGAEGGGTASGSSAAVPLTQP